MRNGGGPRSPPPPNNAFQKVANFRALLLNLKVRPQREKKFVSPCNSRLPRQNPCEISTMELRLLVLLLCLQCLVREKEKKNKKQKKDFLGNELFSGNRLLRRCGDQHEDGSRRRRRRVRWWRTRWDFKQKRVFFIFNKINK